MNTSVIPNVIIQHAEEASFLWLLRDRAVKAPHYSLKDLARLDDRVEAHIDGLRIAGDAGWEICKEALETGEGSEVFVAAVLAFESGDEARIQEVLDAGSRDAGLSRGIISALGWMPYEKAERHIRQLLNADSPDLRRIGIAASANHGRDPGKVLAEALSDADPALRALALKAAGQLGRIDLLPLLRSNLAAEDEGCRFFAAWSACLLGDASAIDTLKSFACSNMPWKEEALSVALRRMDLASALQWQMELAQGPESRRLSIVGAGVIGDPALVPWLIGQMAIPDLARGAGEAFKMITGVDIVYEDLEGKKPEGFEAGPTENPEDEGVAMDPDEDLPWPNPELIAQWWQNNQGRFQTGTRYLLGRPITSENLHQVLKTGFQRQRIAAALHLKLMQPDTHLFPTSAPAWEQLAITR